MVRLEEITVIRAPIERCFDLARSVEVHLKGRGILAPQKSLVGDEHQGEHGQKGDEERANGYENFVKEGIPGFAPLISILSPDVGMVEGRVVFKPGRVHTFIPSGHILNLHEGVTSSQHFCLEQCWQSFQILSRNNLCSGRTEAEGFEEGGAVWGRERERNLTDGSRRRSVEPLQAGDEFFGERFAGFSPE